MKIMLVNHYAGSDAYGMEFRPFYLARELVQMGHEVTIIAADCSHLRKKNPVISQSFSEEICEGVLFVFVKTVHYKKNDAKRFLNMFSFLYQIKKNSAVLYEKYKPEVVIASSTYPYDVRAAKRIADFGENVKVVYEIHDIWPLSLIEIYGISPRNPYMQSLQRAENYAYENADFVVSILPDVDRHIKELGYNNVKYCHIPNGIVVDEEKKPAPSFIVDEAMRLKGLGKFILMYLGGFSQANALEDLLAAAKLLPQNVQLVLVGEGPLKEGYRALIAADKHSNISLMDSVEKMQVTGTLSYADALYIGAKRTKLYRFGVGMNKIFDYMLAKKPILYGIEASNNFAELAKCGITIKPESAEAIVNGVKKLLAMDTSELTQMGENGYDYVMNNHDYKKLAKQFVDLVSGGV